jgi:hypothetical protein
VGDVVVAKFDDGIYDCVCIATRTTGFEVVYDGDDTSYSIRYGSCHSFTVTGALFFAHLSSLCTSLLCPHSLWLWLLHITGKRVSAKDVERLSAGSTRAVKRAVKRKAEVQPTKRAKRHVDGTPPPQPLRLEVPVARVKATKPSREWLARALEPREFPSSPLWLRSAPSVRTVSCV